MQQITPITNDPGAGVTVQMTIDEFMDFRSRGKQQADEVVTGLTGLMKLFGCSRSKAYSISHMPWFQPAIVVRSGRFVSFWRNRALELARQHTLENSAKWGGGAIDIIAGEEENK